MPLTRNYTYVNYQVIVQDIERTRFRVLIDTGAQISDVSSSLLNKINKTPIRKEYLQELKLLHIQK